MTERDERLGRALRGLEVPDHGPDFFPRLLHRLEREAARGSGPHRRRPRRWKAPPTLLAATAAAVLVVAIVASVVGSDRPRPGRGAHEPPVRLISAAEVRARVGGAIGGLRTLQGEVALECEVEFGPCLPPEGGGRATLRWTFAVTAAGDERVTGIGHRDDMAYSAERGEQRSVSEGPPPLVQVITGLPPGPPDFAARGSLLRREVASFLRAFLATTDDVPVTEVSEGGRDAWRLVVPVEPNKLAGPGRSGDALEMVVDRQSGFPLRVTETLGGRFLREVRLSNLVVDAPVDASAFLLDLPAGIRPFRQDAGFRRVALDKVAEAVGYRPVLPDPSSLPAGYVMAEVTVAARAQPTGTEGANPPSTDVVSVAYRRGFDRIVVTTRATGSAEVCSTVVPGSGPSACWADPLASGEGIRDEPRPFTLSGGALAGSRAELVLSPRGIPHVWAIGDRLVVTVAGDASGDELARIAESFAAVG